MTRAAWMYAAPLRFSRAGSLLQKTPPYVGASLLAMDVDDDAGSLDAHGALEFFASKLAPTKD
jgi:hypothetical protein